MVADRDERRANKGRGWFYLAAIGGAASLYLAWRRRQPHAARNGIVGAHARIVSLEQLREEADWTKSATNYKGGAKGG